MRIQYQVTLYNPEGKYKPVSCIVTREEADLAIPSIKKEIVQAGIQKICSKRYWSKQDLQRYGFSKAKTRVYDPEKFAKEAEARYTAIKEAKYASGEWERPKNS